MKRGLSLIELAQKIEGNRDLKADYIAPARALVMDADDDGVVSLTLPGQGSFPVLPVAHDQIGAKTGIPAKYYDRMLSEDPGLLARNVNRWLGDDGDKRMLRTLGGDLRAFLSDRYARVENEEIAEAVLPVLMDTPGIEVTAAEITDRKMYLLATTSRLTRDVKVGDAVQAGVAISNSEVGLGAVSIRPLVYRLRCLNGMIIPDAKLTARHVGRRISGDEDLNAIFSDEARQADDRALLLKVRDVVRHALDEAAFNAAVDKMAGLTQERIGFDPAKSVEVLAKKIGATESERSSILHALIKSEDLTAFGLVNAVTAQAHGATSFDRAVEFEAAGGSLLNLEPREWREILAAA